MITAQVVLINSDGLILGVSRKHDHNNFGLAGGKMESIDNNDPMATAIRECKEETGLDATNLRLVFAIHKHGNMSYTYLANYTGEVKYNEPHLVKWVPFQALINGSFGGYNKMVSESLLDIGVKFQMDIDFDGLYSELEKYVNLTVRKGYQKPFVLYELIKNRSGFGAEFHLIFTDSQGNELDEEFGDHDEDYEQNIRDIGQKYHTSASIPSYYYRK
jgi:ADP-ribose pyrophosphatase YjhB (NUDIX family)